MGAALIAIIALASKISAMNKEYIIKSRGLFKDDTETPFKISRTQIEAFVECPRCFYLNHRHGIRRPPGPPFTINMLVDRLLKKEFDVHRLAGTAHPIMIEHALDAVPFQHAMIDDWRNNFKGMTWLDPRNNLKITGSVDDIWQHRYNNKLIVVDYKATAKNGDVTLDDEWKISYKRQMEIYIWLLRKQNLDVDDRGFFLYANGHDGDGFDHKIKFDVSLLPYVGNCDWIEPILLRIKACLMQPSLPSAPDDCEFCGYIAGVATKLALK
jgi:CRISPR/Cas system-associated exonuclease Cas4 (RecB family)